MNEQITIGSEETTLEIADDGLILAANQAERRIEAIKKVKAIVLRVTNSHDWVDLGGKPYLQASGSEKVGSVFGISWRIDEPTLTMEDDGHYSYTYRGYFTMGGRTIEFAGSRGTKDPFFSKVKGADKPLSEIDRNDIKKAAQTNLIGNGVTRMLGIRNMTWEELEASGIKREKTSSVTYNQAEMSEDAKDLRSQIGKMLLEMAGGDKDGASKLLITHTTFVGKDGKTFKGKASLSEVSERAMSVTHDKVSKAYDAWKANAPAAAEDDFDVPIDFDKE